MPSFRGRETFYGKWGWVEAKAFLKIYLCLAALAFVVVREAFSSGEQGLLSSRGAEASHCSGFPCCRAWALGLTGFSSCNTWALERRLRSFGTQA